MFSKNFLPTTDMNSAEESCGGFFKNENGNENVIFEIYVDLNFINDIGINETLNNCDYEWLLAPGAEFEIGKVNRH